MKLQFLGATKTVTGSKYLVSGGGAKILVDCGLFQGYKQLRLRNWQHLPIAPSSLDAVLLTHAHLDHSGYLPLLIKQGFSGKVYCTEATYDLCKILLPDSGHLQEEDAAYANRHGFSKHAPALPLYTQQDAEHALKSFSPVAFDTRVSVAGGLGAVWRHAGHILGAATVAIDDGATILTFSGDLGRSNDILMMPPVPIEHTDYLVVESTYGNRVHSDRDPMVPLGDAIRDTANRGGVVVIPSFAVGRAQSLLYYLHLLKESGAIPAVLPVYLDSPMAKDATAIYHKHRKDHRLTEQQCHAMCHAAQIINSVEESKALLQKRVPMVIIAASGMATGGRVLHHLKAFASNPRNTVIFVGHQAGGTRGASMVAGADTVKIHGELVPVRAQVLEIDNLSAHADSNEMLSWLAHFKMPPKKLFITHGEPEAAEALRARISQDLGWPCQVPEYGDVAEMGEEGKGVDDD